MSSSSAALQDKTNILHNNMVLLELSFVELVNRVMVFMSLSELLGPSIQKAESGFFLTRLTALKAAHDIVHKAWKDLDKANTYQVGEEDCFNAFKRSYADYVKTLDNVSQSLLQHSHLLAEITLGPNDRMRWRQANFLNHMVRYTAPCMMPVNHLDDAKAVASFQKRVPDVFFAMFNKVISEFKRNASVQVGGVKHSIEKRLAVIQQRKRAIEEHKQEVQNEIKRVEDEIDRMTAGIVAPLKKIISMADEKLRNPSVDARDILKTLDELRSTRKKKMVEKIEISFDSFDAISHYPSELRVLNREEKQLNEKLGSVRKLPEVEELESIKEKAESCTAFILNDPFQLFAAQLEPMVELLKEFFVKYSEMIPGEEKQFVVPADAAVQPLFPSQFVFYHVVHDLGLFVDSKEIYKERLLTELGRAQQKRSSIFSALDEKDLQQLSVAMTRSLDVKSDNKSDTSGSSHTVDKSSSVSGAVHSHSGGSVLPSSLPVDVKQTQAVKIIAGKVAAIIKDDLKLNSSPEIVIDPLQDDLAIVLRDKEKTETVSLPMDEGLKLIRSYVPLVEVKARDRGSMVAIPSLQELLVECIRNKNQEFAAKLGCGQIKIESLQGALKVTVYSADNKNKESFTFEQFIQRLNAAGIVINKNIVTVFAEIEAQRKIVLSSGGSRVARKGSTIAIAGKIGGLGSSRAASADAARVAAAASPVSSNDSSAGAEEKRKAALKSPTVSPALSAASPKPASAPKTLPPAVNKYRKGP